MNEKVNVDSAKGDLLVVFAVKDRPKKAENYDETRHRKKLLVSILAQMKMQAGVPNPAPALSAFVSHSISQ